MWRERLPRINTGRLAELIARADSLLNICSLLGTDNKLSSCPTRRVIRAPMNEQIRVSRFAQHSEPTVGLIAEQIFGG